METINPQNINPPVCAKAKPETLSWNPAPTLTITLLWLPTLTLGLQNERRSPMTIRPQKVPLRGNMPQTTEQPPAASKLFNVIVDETALIAGLKKSTRDGVKKWVNNKSIRLFVPLHSEPTSALKTGQR
jgi:hypothetical protein